MPASVVTSFASIPAAAWGLVVAALLSIVAGMARAAADDAAEDLRAVEVAFAKTMADRDHAAFVSFLDDETIFFSGDDELRGRDAVAAAWAGYYEGDAAPFSWSPDVVTVIDSGTIGLTSGPVLAPDGTRFATFMSVWRRNASGEWRIVLDRGHKWCE